MKTFNTEDLKAMDKGFRTTFINSISGFKSLNLVGTLNQDGGTNLAVFNSIFHVGANPPYLGMVFRPHEVERHSLENILKIKNYTLNHVNENMIRSAHQTSARYPKSTSEFYACGFTPFFSKNNLAPYVAESNVKIGLELKEKLNVKINNTIIIIGQINEIIIDEAAIESDGFVDLKKLNTCTVAGLDAYFSVNKIERLSYSKINKEVSKI
jgi:flavin reductase (DIM6/NTAB) family NADH-FMN oxidoreductase RutF